jgi:hypothetical protein
MSETLEKMRWIASLDEKLDGQFSIRSSLIRSTAH